MGKKTYVSTVTQRMLSSEDFQSSDTIAMQRFLIQQRNTDRVKLKDTTLADHIRNARGVGLPQKFKAAYRYVDKPNNKYYFGKPKYKASSSPTVDAEVNFKKYIKELHGIEPAVLAIRVGEKNLYHAAWEHLVREYGYSGKLNELRTLSVLLDTPVYLKSGQLHVKQATYDNLFEFGELNQIGLAMSYGKCFARAQNDKAIQPDLVIGTQDKLVITYSYRLGSIEITRSESIDLEYVELSYEAGDDVPDHEEWLQVTYKLGNEYKWFSYLMGSNEILELEKTSPLVVISANYYPRLYTRVDGQTLNELRADDKRRVSSELILKKLAMNLGEVTDQIHTGIGEMTKEIKYIFMHLSLPINQDMNDTLVAKYFYRYFSQLFDICKPTADPTVRGGLTQDLSDKVYAQSMSFSGITKKKFTGSKLKVGQYRTRFAYSATNNSQSKRHIITYQEDAKNYWEIEVLQLQIVHRYAGKHTEKDSGDDDNLSIPIEVGILDSFTQPQKELLINRGFQITVATKQVVKKKWYQSGIFKVAMAIISIGMNLVVPGSGFTLHALMTAVAVTVATSVAISVAIDVFIKVASKLGLSAEVIGLIALIAIAVTTIKGGTIKTDLSKLLNPKLLMESLNTSLSVYSKAANDVFNQIQKETELFNSQDLDRQEKLKEAQSLLETGLVPAHLELLVSSIRNDFVRVGETPSEFMERMDSYDISYMAIDLIRNYVPFSLSVYPTTKPREYSRTSVEEVLLIT